VSKRASLKGVQLAEGTLVESEPSESELSFTPAISESRHRAAIFLLRLRSCGKARKKEHCAMSRGSISMMLPETKPRSSHLAGVRDPGGRSAKAKQAKIHDSSGSKEL
jgi:hypothetical protein